MRRARTYTTALMICIATAVHVQAQVTETPVSFDSAGRVRTLTTQLVTRLGLAAPVWPVAGVFVEARLFASSAGGHVLVVERYSGAVDRYALADADAASLRDAIDRSLVTTRAVATGDHPQSISEPAGRAFARNQLILAFGLYGPLLAATTNDAKTGTAVYLIGTSASYFAAMAVSKHNHVTRAQNHLATDGALRGWGTAAGLLYAFNGDGDRRTYSAVGLAGALAGSFAGYQFGTRLNDSEAQAASSFSNFAALTAAGISGATGIAQRSDNGREVVGAAVAAAALGYGFGPQYPRLARYVVTPGDVQMLTIGAVLGAAAAYTPFASGHADADGAFAAATAGLLAGIFAADRLAAAPYDYSTADVSQVALGGFAGALLGAGVAVLAEPSPSGTLALVTSGAMLGVFAGHEFAAPTRARTTALRVGSTRRVSLEVNPTALALGASRVPGNHALVSLRF